MNSRKNSFKRVAAGALAVLTVAAYTAPVANVGGLTNVNVLTANAEELVETTFTYEAALKSSIISLSATRPNGNALNYDADTIQDANTELSVAQGKNVTIKSVVPLQFKIGEKITKGATSGKAIAEEDQFYGILLDPSESAKAYKDSTTQAGYKVINTGYVAVHQSVDSTTGYQVKKAGAEISNAAEWDYYRLILTKENDGYTEPTYSNGSYTYSFVSPGAVAVKGVKLTGNVDITNADCADLTQVWNKAKFTRTSENEKIALTAIAAGDVKFYSANNDGAAGVAVDTGTFTKPIEAANVFVNEKINIVGKKSFGAYVWDGVDESTAQYFNATYMSTGKYAGNYVCSFNIPNTAVASAKIALTAVEPEIDYSFTDGGASLVADGDSYNKTKIATITASYVDKNKAAGSQNVTVANEGSTPNVNSSANIDEIVVKASANGDKFVTITAGNYGYYRIVKNPDNKETKEVLVASQTIDSDPTTYFGTGKVITPGADKKFTDAGTYNIQITVYVKENGGIIPKTLDYTFTISPAEALTEANVKLTAKDYTTDNEPATAGKLKQDDGAAMHTLTYAGIKDGVVQIVVNENYKDGDTLTITPELYTNTALTKTYDSTVTDPAKKAKYSGDTTCNKLDKVRTITVSFTNAEYGQATQAIDVDYVVTRKATPKVDWINGTDKNNETTNNEIQISLDTATKLEQRIFDSIYLQNITEADVEFEYVKMKGKKASTRDLDAHYAGLPTEKGEYTVFLKYDNASFYAIDVIIAEHTLYFVPTKDALNDTYGDAATFKKDYKAVDVNNKKKSVAALSTTGTVYQLAVDAYGEPMLDEDGKYIKANAMKSCKKKDSPLYKKDYYTYDEDSVHPVYVVDANKTIDGKDYYAAGKYLVEVGGVVDNQTGYAVEPSSYIYNVAKAELTADMFVVYPKTYDGNTQTITQDDIVEVTKWKNLGLSVERVDGKTSGIEAKAYPITIGVATAAEENFEGEVDTSWNIVKKAQSYNFDKLKFNNKKTTLYPGALVHVEYDRPADSEFLKSKVKRFGVIADYKGMLDKPTYADLAGYEAVDYTYTKYMKTDGTIKPGMSDDEQKIQNAYKALQLGNGFYETKSNPDVSKLNYGASLAPLDVETGVWARPFVECEDGSIYYGEVKYINMQEEATKQLNLTMGDQKQLSTKNASTNGITYAEAKKALGITSDKSTMTVAEKKKIRAKLQSGYDTETGTYFAYGSYTLDEDSPIKKETVKAFGVVVDDMGVFSAQGTTVKGKDNNNHDIVIDMSGKNTDGELVKDELKLGYGKRYLYGKASTSNTVYDVDEYGAKVTPYNTATGIWARCYVDLGDGIVVYTDPVYISSVSKFYDDSAADAKVQSMHKVNNGIAKITIQGNGFTDIPGVGSTTAVVDCGVIVDDSGSLIKRNATGSDYENTLLTYEANGAAVADSKLILGKGYKEGKDTSVSMAKITGAKMTYDVSLAKDASGNAIPLVYRPYVTVKINGKNVTLYGKINITNQKADNLA